MNKEITRTPKITIGYLKYGEYHKLNKLELDSNMGCIKIIKTYGSNGSDYLLQNDYSFMSIDLEQGNRVEIEIGTVNSKVDSSLSLIDSPRNSKYFNYDIRKFMMDKDMETITDMVTSFLETDDIEKYLSSIDDRKCHKCYVKKKGIYNV